MKEQDNNRRMNEFKNFYKNKVICDFDGDGYFLKSIKMSKKFMVELNLKISNHWINIDLQSNKISMISMITLTQFSYSCFRTFTKCY